MLEKTVRDLINNQVNQELYSAYLYLDFARYFTERGLNGYAGWFTVQAKEELDHAKIFFDYLLSQGEDVMLTAIAAPMIHPTCRTGSSNSDCDFKVLEEALAHERLVTSLIDDIYFAASGVGDSRTMNFLEWFIAEQREEEDNAIKLLNEMSLFGMTSGGLYALDREMGQREYKAPKL